MNYKVIFLYNQELRQEVVDLWNLFREVEMQVEDKELLIKIVDELKKMEHMLGLGLEEKFFEILKQWIQEDEWLVAKKNILQYLINLLELLDSFSCKNIIDDKFCDIYRYILNLGVDGLYEQMIQEFNQYCEKEPVKSRFLMKSYNRVLYWGGIDYDRGNYEMLRNRAESLVDNANEFIWMYLKLSDYTSKRILNNIIINWITFSHEVLDKIPRNQYDQYFDFDIISDAGKVFVDAGACKGDTIESFIRNYRNYEKIYSYEITPDTFQILLGNVSRYENVDCRCKGVSNKSGLMYVTICEDIGGNRLGENGDIEVPVVTLDEDIVEKIDFIKMDIEGAEYNALLGAKGHIQKEHPCLAIAAYHNNVDIFRLAKLIYEMDENYKFYYRYYGGSLYPNDYVLYAI